MLDKLDVSGYENVVRVRDSDSGLDAVIAVHSTRLGPAAGGVRMRVYPDFKDALDDALRLSRAMTFKNAAADLPLGGGKSVILGEPAYDKTPERLRAFARAVEALGGAYWAAEDMGVGPDDMAIMSCETKYVAGLPSGSFAGGDPSPATARGVFDAMRVALRHQRGSSSIAGLTVAVQGLGHVGASLCSLLHEAGARLVVTDVNARAIEAVSGQLGCELADVHGILEADADIVAPCAIGGVLTPSSVARLRADLVVGAANNQLSDPDVAWDLHRRGILYAPDYVANGGGIINVAAEILQVGNRSAWISEKLEGLVATLDEVFLSASREGVPPSHIADRLVMSRISATTN
ncbi:MAG: Glu/Leu/Phe/Val family dehydrogenase [Dongiaceae bacterium]